MKEKQKSILVQKNTTQSFQKELLTHVTARMHLSCAKERRQTQKALYDIISCQWISAKAQLEAENYICGCQGIGVQEGVNANSPREHFQTNGTFSMFFLS